MWENTAAIHSILKKKIFKAKFSISSILKNKIDRDNIWKHKKKTQKNFAGNTVAIHSVLWWKL
jgi:hypothetical protein